MYVFSRNPLGTCCIGFLADFWQSALYKTEFCWKPTAVGSLNNRKNLGESALMVGRICPPGWNRIKVSENVGRTVRPCRYTSLLYLWLNTSSIYFLLNLGSKPHNSLIAPSRIQMYLCNKEGIIADILQLEKRYIARGRVCGIVVFSCKVLYALLFLPLCLGAKNGQINQLSKLKLAINVK